MSLAFLVPRASHRSPLQVATEVQSTAFRIARLTLTAVASYLLALAVLPVGGPDPLLAPLTALLVVQYSVYETIRSSVLRVASVASGVLVAVLFAGTVGFSWWSLGLSILAALVIGHALRLGEHVLEVPISTMLIFALGASSGLAGAGRVMETLVGAATGLAATLLVPSVRVRPAEDAVQGIAERLTRLVNGMAADLRDDPAQDEAARWLAAAGRLMRHIGRTDRALAAAEQSVRFNPRARRLVDAGVALRHAVVTMEHFTLSLRGLTRSLADDERLGGEGRLLVDPALRSQLADALTEIAASIAAYGRLTRGDLERDARPVDAEQELERRIRTAREHRNALVGVLRARAADGDRWPLYGEILMDLDRLIDHLRVENRVRAREQWRRQRASRRLPERPARVVRQAGIHLRNAAAAAALSATLAAESNADLFAEEGMPILPYQYPARFGTPHDAGRHQTVH